MGEIESVALTKAGFKKFMFLLEYLAGQQGFQYGIITAQSALETNFGKSVLAKNLFGIKCTRYWLKKGFCCQSAQTMEEIRGEIRIITGFFRVYNTFEHSVQDYFRIIRVLKRYRDAWGKRHNYKLYFRAIAKAGYATDSKYASKCIRIYEQLFSLRPETQHRGGGAKA